MNYVVFKKLFSRGEMFIKVFRKEKNLAYLFILPSFVFIGIFHFFSMGFAFLLGFFKYDPLSLEKTFVGIANYQNLVADPLFWKVTFNTFYFVVGTVPTTMFLSLAVALLFNQKIRGSYLYRTIYFLPTVTATVAVSMVWLWLYSPSFGLFNYLCKMMGLKPLLWLNSPTWAMPSVIIMSIWKGIGYSAVIYFAGLQGIPEQPYEAARIDGAGRWVCFKHITWPGLMPTTFFIFVTSIISSFQVFDQVLVMTIDGGPVNSTNVLVLYLYQKAFLTFEMGYASSIAIFLFVIIMMFSYFQMKYISKIF